MWRSILGIIAGIVVGGITVGLIEIPGYFIHPPPPGLDMRDTGAMKSHFAKAPLPALLGVGIAWTIGPLVGAWLTALIAGRAFLLHGLIIGVVFSLLDLMNIVSFPHPIWLAIVGVVAPLLSSYVGASLAARRTRQQPRGAQPYDMREKNMAC
jgi:uncharacterized protein YacL